MSFSLLMISIVLTIYDAFRDFHSDIHDLVVGVEILVSCVILLEYVGRLYLAKNKLKFMLEPLSIIDLLAVLPLFQPLRMLRFIVVFARILRIAYRYKPLLSGFLMIFRNIYFELVFILSLFLLVFISSILILYSLEKHAGNDRITSLFDAVYMVIITMTTVGYGDVTPITKEGRFISMFLGMSGIFLFSLIVASVSAGLSSYIYLIKSGMVSYREMENHVILCGWNETGSVLVERLRATQKDMLVITTQEVNLPRGVYYKRGDFGSEEVMRDAGMERASVVIVLAEKLPGYSEDSVDARTILAGMQARDINKNAVIILELLLRENAKLLKKRAIADYVVIGGEVIGNILSRFVLNEHFGNLINYLLEKAEIVYMDATEGKSISDIGKEIEKHGYRIVGIEKDGKVRYFPKLSHVISEGERLLVVKEQSTARNPT
ncbi:MAG: ion channel [Aquificaceae bacterium]